MSGLQSVYQRKCRGKNHCSSREPYPIAFHYHAYHTYCLQQCSITKHVLPKNKFSKSKLYVRSSVQWWILEFRSLFYLHSNAWTMATKSSSGMIRYFSTCLKAQQSNMKYLFQRSFGYSAHCLVGKADMLTAASASFRHAFTCTISITQLVPK
jgi:hypothetical protein